MGDNLGFMRHDGRWLGLHEALQGDAQGVPIMQKGLVSAFLTDSSFGGMKHEGCPARRGINHRRWRARQSTSFPPHLTPKHIEMDSATRSIAQNVTHDLHITLFHCTPEIVKHLCRSFRRLKSLKLIMITKDTWQRYSAPSPPKRTKNTRPAASYGLGFQLRVSGLGFRVED